MSLQNLAELGSSLNKRKVQQILESFDALDIDIPDYRELSMGDTIRKLKNAQKFLSDDSPDASKIDSILLPLLELEDINPFGAGPYDLNNTKLLFSKENSILSDINEIFLFSKVSDLLEIKYLSHVDDNWNWEEHAKGIVFGQFLVQWYRFLFRSKIRRQEWFIFLLILVLRILKYQRMCLKPYLNLLLNIFPRHFMDISVECV